MPDDELPFYDEDPSRETEEDVPALDLEAIRSAFVTSADWTTETLLAQMRRGNIELNPRFQRREVWHRRRKSEFIESILLNLPIPQIVLAERREDPNTYVVLDGKQRLLTLRQYAANADDDRMGFTSVKLSGLTVRSDLNGSSYADLSERSASDLNAFDNHTIRTVVIRSWPDEDFLFRVFLRLNTGSVPLAPQELRQALHPGPFVDFADDFSLDNAKIQQALRINGPDRRMRDAELVVRYFAFTHYLTTYRGNLKPFLDETCTRLNQAWPNQEAAIRADAALLDDAITATIKIFGEREAFTRWQGGAYERPFNRAVFDAMVFVFRNPPVAAAASARPTEITGLFQNLCVEDLRFDQSLTATTKTVGAIAYRLVTWADRVAATLGVAVPVPPALRARLD